MKKIILTVPVYNEEKVLETAIIRLHNYMRENIKNKWEILIANNASTDKTKEIADNLTKKLSNVKVFHLTSKGRGNALKHAWMNSEADVYAYCDVDLATDIIHLKKLFNSVLEGNDIVTGSRYIKTSDTRRTLKRLVLSKGYIYLIKLFFKTKIIDFQCGFKAVNKKFVKEILPKVENKEWFFDTESLLLAENTPGFKIEEIPITWYERKDSKVRIIKIVYQYITNIIELKFRIRKR